MSSIKVKVTGIFIIVTSLIVFCLTILLLGVEYLGASKYLLGKWGESLGINYNYSTKLISDGYYNGEYIKKDPYSAYTVQHIHPYYTFSLPWRTKDQAELVSNIVTMNPDGFRKNPNNVKEHRKTAILLGGSTAFGHFSSSDETTIASVLSKTLEMNVVNRNAPSWNSHQELVALAKYFYNYKFSISFTLANDISVACHENNRWDDGVAYLDAPESFITLQNKVNDIRGRVTTHHSLKGYAKFFFPDTYRLLGWIKHYHFTGHGQSPKKAAKNYVCPDVKPQDIAVSFLRNQKTMNQLSSARGATHILALQPDISLVDKNAVDHKLRNSVYDEVMNSDYCAKNVCIDMRKTKNPVTVEALYNGKNIQTALFVDDKHLTDNGVFMYTAIIAEKLSKF